MPWPARYGIERILSKMRNLPRITETNLVAPLGKDLERPLYVKRPVRHDTKGSEPRIGYDGTVSPFYLKVPGDHYYAKHASRRGYPPITLRDLQLLIDLGRLDTSKPIDLVSLINTDLPFLELDQRHAGFHLTDEGIDRFKAKIHIEVQHAKEHVIAAVEKNGGSITTAYYDFASLNAMVDAKLFFESGKPIPRRRLPPEDVLEYYSNPKNRGYLSDPVDRARERALLAQKYGYKLPEIKEHVEEKDPRQVFYGLHPGWIVNLKDKIILKPTEQKLKEYYLSNSS